MAASFGDIQSMIPSKYRDRLSYNEETGSVSFNTNGLERRRNGSLKNSSIRSLNTIISDTEVNILYVNGETVPIRIWNYKTTGSSNSAGKYNIEVTSKKTDIKKIHFADFARSRTQRDGALGDWYNGTVLSSRATENSFVELPPEGYDAVGRYSSWT